MNIDCFRYPGAIVKGLFFAGFLLLSCPATAGILFLGLAVPANQTKNAAKLDERLDAAMASQDPNLLYLDKAWAGIDFLLTGGIYANTPTGWAIMGGEPLGEDRGYGPFMVVQPAQVKEIAQALEGITPDELVRRFDAEKMEKDEIYPGYWKRDGLEARNYLVTNYVKLRKFYKGAAGSNLAVVLLFY